NPFNSTVRISFEVPEKLRGKVSLMIVNVLGQSVARFDGQELKNGFVDWKADGCASGLYLARLAAGEQSDFAKLMLVK
ncbi:MAG: hypothetical protein V1784_00865, partial [bacterium]